jgi:hypothetical protein
MRLLFFITKIIAPIAHPDIDRGVAPICIEVFPTNKKLGILLANSRKLLMGLNNGDIQLPAGSFRQFGSFNEFLFGSYNYTNFLKVRSFIRI